MVGTSKVDLFVDDNDLSSRIKTVSMHESAEDWFVHAVLEPCLRSLQYVKLRLLPEGVIMSHSYSSDISREQFARILPCLESARRPD